MTCQLDPQPQHITWSRMPTVALWTACCLLPQLVALQQVRADETKPAERPRVLIIGDSISLGYTPHVIELLKGDVDVRHNPGNAQHSGTGLKKIDGWLGDTDWDVIHFNWGLWDLCYRNPKLKTQGRRDKVNGTVTLSVEQYEQNIEKLVARMAKTDAVLIWGSTTVVPEKEAGRIVGDDLKYNAAATKVMKKYGVQINDLNALSRTFPPELFTAPGNVHFKPDGSKKLADQVAKKILAALYPNAVHAPLSRIMFGSCVKQNLPAPIFDSVISHRPELFIFLGDNIYGDTEDMQVLKDKYQTLGEIPGVASLRKKARVLATWDDHDYGVNDGGENYPKRVESEQIFLDFWNDAADSPRRKRPGVYDSHVFGPEGQRVQVILLDTRYFRSPLKKAERRVGGPYVPDKSADKTMLGEAQWKWLEEQFRLPAELRIVASSIQCVAQDAGQETWSNLPRERERLFRLILHTKANGVMIISGDRHWSELSSASDGLPYPVYDLTSSSLNTVHGRGTPTDNRFRANPTTYHRENFGAITVDWTARDPLVTLQIRDIDGEPKLSKSVPLSSLK